MSLTGEEISNWLSFPRRRETNALNVFIKKPYSTLVMVSRLRGKDSKRDSYRDRLFPM
jgi:hypothetical protein